MMARPRQGIDLAIAEAQRHVDELVSDDLRSVLLSFTGQ
jgi:hypothetical protein